MPACLTTQGCRPALRVATDHSAEGNKPEHAADRRIQPGTCTVSQRSLAVERASWRSAFELLPGVQTRARADSVGATSTTDSPAATSSCARHVSFECASGVSAFCGLDQLHEPRIGRLRTNNSSTTVVSSWATTLSAGHECPKPVICQWGPSFNFDT